jgi:hypothetical protein
MGQRLFLVATLTMVTAIATMAPTSQVSHHQHIITAYYNCVLFCFILRFPADRFRFRLVHFVLGQAPPLVATANFTAEIWDLNRCNLTHRLSTMMCAIAAMAATSRWANAPTPASRQLLQQLPASSRTLHWPKLGCE